MTMGSLLAPPEMILPCETQCYICDGSYKKIILPVIYSGVLDLLGSRRFNDKIPIDLTYDECDFFVDKLAKDEETVTRYHITTFYFQLFATRIISFEKIGTKLYLLLYQRIVATTNFSKTFWIGRVLNSMKVGVAADLFHLRRFLSKYP